MRRFPPLCLILLAAAGLAAAATVEADSAAVAAAARALLGPDERIHRIVPVPEPAWSTTRAEYLVDLAPREPGEITGQLVGTWNGDAWEFSRHRWLFVYPPEVSARAVRLHPPVDIARACRVLEVVAAELASGERPVSIRPVQALDAARRVIDYRTAPAAALRIFRVMAACTDSSGYRTCHFTVRAQGDSVFVFAIAEGTP